MFLKPENKRQEHLHCTLKGGLMKKLLILSLTVASLLCRGSSISYADELTFTNGIDIWLSSSGTADTGNANLGWGRSIGSNARNYDALIKFTDMFGTNALSQIPYGSTINSATLKMWVGYDNNITSSIYMMSYDWNASSTWNTIGSTGGIVPGTNTKATYELQWTGTTDAWSQRSFDLTSSVQEWSGGADEFGWGFTAPRVDNASAMSLNSSVSYRPYLTVDFTPAVAPEPLSALLFVTGGLGLAIFRRKK